MPSSVVDLSQATGVSARESAGKDYVIDGIVLYPPPEDLDVRNHFRVTIKQVAGGQTADVGGRGGCDITMRGKVPKRYAAWLKLVEKRLDDSAGEGILMLLTDPLQDIVYEVLCKDYDIRISVGNASMYEYEFDFVGQVGGASWTAGLPMTTEGSSKIIPAFDQTSIDAIVGDAQRISADYKKQGATGNGDPNQEVLGGTYQEPTDDPTVGTRTHGGGAQSPPTKQKGYESTSGGSGQTLGEIWDRAGVG